MKKKCFLLFWLSILPVLAMAISFLFIFGGQTEGIPFIRSKAENKYSLTLQASNRPTITSSSGDYTIKTASGFDYPFSYTGASSNSNYHIVLANGGTLSNGTFLVERAKMMGFYSINASFSGNLKINLYGSDRSDLLKSITLTSAADANFNGCKFDYFELVATSATSISSIVFHYTCSESGLATRLATPTPSVSGTTVSWPAVANASRYLVTEINELGQRYDYVNTNSYTIGALHGITNVCVASITVIAYPADYSGYVESNISDAVAYYNSGIETTNKSNDYNMTTRFLTWRRNDEATSIWSNNFSNFQSCAYTSAASASLFGIDLGTNSNDIVCAFATTIVQKFSSLEILMKSQSNVDATVNMNVFVDGVMQPNLTVHSEDTSGASFNSTTHLLTLNHRDAWTRVCLDCSSYVGKLVTVVVGHASFNTLTGDYWVRFGGFTFSNAVDTSKIISTLNNSGLSDSTAKSYFSSTSNSTYADFYSMFGSDYSTHGGGNEGLKLSTNDYITLNLIPNSSNPIVGIYFRTFNNKATIKFSDKKSVVSNPADYATISSKMNGTVGTMNINEDFYYVNGHDGWSLIYFDFKDFIGQTIELKILNADSNDIFFGGLTNTMYDTKSSSAFFTTQFKPSAFSDSGFKNVWSDSNKSAFLGKCSTYNLSGDVMNEGLKISTDKSFEIPVFIEEGYDRLNLYFRTFRNNENRYDISGYCTSNGGFNFAPTLFGFTQVDANAKYSTATDNGTYLRIDAGYNDGLVKATFDLSPYVGKLVYIKVQGKNNDMGFGGFYFDGFPTSATGAYLNIYDNIYLVSSTVMTLDTTDPTYANKQLYAKGISATEGYHAVCFRKGKGFWGGSYGHDSSFNLDVSESGNDYVIQLTTTYDFYYKFNDTALTSYNSAWVAPGVANKNYTIIGVPDWWGNDSYKPYVWVHIKNGNSYWVLGSYSNQTVTFTSQETDLVVLTRYNPSVTKKGTSWDDDEPPTNCSDDCSVTSGSTTIIYAGTKY